MGEDQFKTILFAFIFMGLIGVLLFTAITSISKTYNKNLTEIQGGVLQLDRFNDTIKDVESTSTTQYNTFRGLSDKSIFSQIADIIGFLTVGVFNLIVDLFDMVTFPMDLVLNILEDVFYIPHIVSSVLKGVMLLLIIFAVWQLSKLGN